MEAVKSFLLDNDSKQLEVLENLIKKHSGSTVKIIGKSTSINQGIEFINKHKPPLLFLATNVQGQKSFDLLNSIEPYDYQVIFIADYDLDAIDSFEYRAVDYLVRPIDIERLQRSVERACNIIRERMDIVNYQLERSACQVSCWGVISIPSYNAIDVIPQGKIVYCKSEGKYTNFYCLDKSVYTATKNIGEFERLLNPNLFYRVHNSFIVNIQYVDKIDKEGGGVCKLKDGREIPIAKRRKIHFYEFIGAIH